MVIDMNRHKQLYRLKPIVTQRLWGGTSLARRLHLQTDAAQPGEIVVAAGFRERDTEVENLGIPLSQLYLERPELFGLTCKQFPLAVNLIDAAQSLSVQVHPDEATAAKNGGGPGLAEAWVVLGCAENSKILAGHCANSEEELTKKVCRQKWEELLRYKTASHGDFYLLPPGTVHAVGSGIQVYEVTHASDVVYRLYDYGRDCTHRPLDTELAMQTIYSPQRIETVEPSWCIHRPGLRITQYMDDPGLFTLRQIELDGSVDWQQEPFGLLTVLQGSGSVNGEAICAGQTLLIPWRFGGLAFEGRFTAMLASYREDRAQTATPPTIRHAHGTESKKR